MNKIIKKKTKKNDDNNKIKTKTKINKNSKNKNIKIIKQKKENNNKTVKLKNQKGGADIVNAAVGTIKSMIGLGVNIGKEIDAIMHMGRDFNKAANVNLPNQTTPDQSVTNTTSSYKDPPYPKAKV